MFSLLRLRCYVQPHSFVSVGSVAATVAVCDVIARAMTAFNACARDGSPRPGFTAADWSSVWCWLAYGVVAFAIGLPQFIPFFGRVSGSHGFIRFITIWSTKGTGPVGLWLKALGLYVPLFLASAFTLTRRNPAQLFFYLGFSAVFLEANFIIFQPWEMDNTKVFYVWVFGASVFVCALMRSLLRVVSRSKLLSGAAVLLLTAVYASLTISGILCSVQETVSNSEMFDLVDVEYARWVRDNTPPHAVFIEPSEHYPRHFRVVRMVTIAFSLLLFVIILFLNTVSPQESALAGRAVLAGYAGWLSSHGLNYGKRMSDMNDMMTGSGNAYRLLYDYNVTHITVPWKLRTSFNIEFLNAVANRVTSNGRFTVFEVARSELLAPVQACNDGDGVAVNVEAKCRERGCMWLPRFAGARCQVSHTLAQGERVIDCAPRMSMTEEKCHDMWCSWYFNYNGPWCQAPSHSVGDRHRAFAPMSILTPDFDCGWHGMDVQQCVDRGCTWTPAGSNPWCTYKGADKKPANIIDTIEPM